MQTNEYGLVPGKAIKSFDIYRAGTLCGFEPQVAERLVAKGLWRPTNGAVAAEVEAKVAQKQIEDDGDNTEFLIGLESGTLKIPHNWRDQHHSKKKSWATAIKGDAPSNVAEADEIIAAAVKDQEDALEAKA
jgi:hypothetical protein